MKDVTKAIVELKREFIRQKLTLLHGLTLGFLNALGLGRVDHKVEDKLNVVKIGVLGDEKVTEAEFDLIALEDFLN